MKAKPKGPFLGINNRLPDFGLKSRDPRKPGDYLRVADNVDIDNTGRLRRRAATALLHATSGMHSLYMDSPTTGYAVRDAVMYRISLPSYSETIFKTLTSNAPVNYMSFAGSLYFSNGTDAGRVNNGSYLPLGMVTPSAPTVATSATPGTLRKGTYQVAVGYKNDTTGEEGGISASSNPVLAADGSLRVTMPGASPGATHINVFVSTCNGAVPMLYTTVAVGTAYVDITALAQGRESNLRFEAPLPAGTLFLFNGRLCSFNGSAIYEGSPFRPGYYLPAEGRVPFPEDVSNVAPTPNGIYVVADVTYWFPGAVMTQVKDIVQKVLPYGGVKGTSFEVPNMPQVGWFGAQGFVLADHNGKADPVMSDTIALTPPATGVTYVRETIVDGTGHRHVVSCGWCLNLDTQAATTYSDYDFTSISGGYGTKADGIYTLSAVGKVTSTIGLGKENFGVEQFKFLPAVYLGGSFDAALSMRIQSPEHDYTYDARSYSSDVRMQRVDPGRGLRANWFDTTISNNDGADFSLASVSFGVGASTRSI